jgi:hypothetical protein
VAVQPARSRGAVPMQMRRERRAARTCRTHARTRSCPAGHVLRLGRTLLRPGHARACACAPPLTPTLLHCRPAG